MTADRMPRESDLDFFLDTLALMEMCPMWGETSDDNKSELVLTKEDVLYVLHYMKVFGDATGMLAYGMAWKGATDGSYKIHSWPDWMVGTYTWDFDSGELFFKGQNITDA